MESKLPIVSNPQTFQTNRQCIHLDHQGASCPKNNDSEDHFTYIARNTENSMKYMFTLKEKPIHVLDSSSEKDSIKNLPIVCSYADMEFKASQKIVEQWKRLMNDQNLILGYMMAGPKTRQLIMDRLRQNVHSECNMDHLMLVSSMLSLYYIVVTQLTKKQDKVLILTPTYYRFLYTLNDQKRQTVECQLKLRKTQTGSSEFYIDFEELQKTFQTNDIKMLVFANPHNPAGRVWKKDELNQLAKLIVKYNCLVFSDDIFLQCMQNPQQNYTSLLEFEEIHQNLIWASAFGKAFNCSGNSFGYAIVPNPQIREKLGHAIMKINLFPNFAQIKLLQSCYTVGDQWRINTVKFIKQNYFIMKEEFKKRQINVDVYTLDSAFVAVLDFAAYKWPHSEIKARLQGQNIFPTYLDGCYVNREKQSISIVRINLAMSREVLMEFINRIQKIVRA